MKKNKTVQEWLPVLKILENGIIKLKNSSSIKILKVIPINYDLKSELEKEVILNSYKTFLKTCNFNIQILIQSNKENLSSIISKINNKEEKNPKIKKYRKKYIEYIQKLNHERKSSAKTFFLIIENENSDNEELNEKYIKIKELLDRCGNRVEEINSKEEIKEILNSFINRRISQIKKE